MKLEIPQNNCPDPTPMTHSKKPEEDGHMLGSGIILVVLACMTAAFPTILALNGVLDTHQVNVIFGMTVWYLFSLCAYTAGILFIRSGIAASGAFKSLAV